jgi:hypothetical protein
MSFRSCREKVAFFADGREQAGGTGIVHPLETSDIRKPHNQLPQGLRRLSYKGAGVFLRGALDASLAWPGRIIL